MTIREIGGLSEIAASYNAALCDVWGVLHNGVRAKPATVHALQRFRAERGPVVMITNAPRPASEVARQITGFGVPDGTFDAIVTSGDVTRDALASRPGAAVLHIGPERDQGIYDGLDLRFVAEDEAELISCTGFYDDRSETPEDYRQLLQRLADRGLPMVCANPDIVVERGDKLVWCGGALADLYARIGGETIMAGKPFEPIYQAALRQAGDPPLNTVLAIGDGMPTDIRGANRFGIDALFVTAGIHAESFGPADRPDPVLVDAGLSGDGLFATAFIPALRWAAEG